MHLIHIIDALILAFLVGGFAGRIRGSGMVSDTVARFGVWGGAVGLFILVNTFNPVYGLAALILAGLGASFGYWGDFDLTQASNRSVANFAKLTAMGCMRFFPLFGASVFVGLEWHLMPSVLAGISFFPSYLLGIQIVKKVPPILKVFPNWPPLLSVFSEWGEFIFWGTIYMALVAGLIL